MIEDFGRRFGLEVIDAFGATEGGLAINRDGELKPGAMGVAGPGIRIVDEAGEELPAARFDADGRLLNADESVGEIVNTEGAGPFEGYYNNDEATGRALRNGWYWSGDLGYMDDDRQTLVRRPQRRLDPGRRRELPGRADRRCDQRAPRRRRGGRLRGAGRAGGRPGDGRARAAPGPCFDPEAFAGWLDARRRHRAEVEAALRAGGRGAPGHRAPTRS